ncbi:hypothetical protein NFB33_003630 [Escherichia albertii]|nr:hypothetical protein [Escherichia albertii]HDK2652459.1 hypothetical protein [Escherichia coli]
MKKTLIALAVAASAAVSGSAMAWTANGTGGSVDMGGTLSPEGKVTPWEVQVGNAVKGLDAKVKKGQKTVDIAVKSAIPLLGIRTQTRELFKGQEGITPQISYGNAVELSSFNHGNVPLTLEVKNSSGVKIGKAVTSLLAVAQGTAKATNAKDNGIYSLYASKSGMGFFGGVGKSPDSVASNPIAAANSIFAGVTDNYNNDGHFDSPKPGQVKFAEKDRAYSAFYASGIEKNKLIKITLDEGACADAPVQWKASLPITVSYM